MPHRRGHRQQPGGIRRQSKDSVKPKPTRQQPQQIDNDIIDMDFGMWFISIKEEPLVKSLKRIPTNLRHSRQTRKEFLDVRKTEITK